MLENALLQTPGKPGDQESSGMIPDLNLDLSCGTGGQLQGGASQLVQGAGGASQDGHDKAPDLPPRHHHQHRRLRPRA